MITWIIPAAYLPIVVENWCFLLRYCFLAYVLFGPCKSTKVRSSVNLRTINNDFPFYNSNFAQLQTSYILPHYSYWSWCKVGEYWKCCRCSFFNHCILIALCCKI
ncbi:hypothetical protein CW304_26955 [Bacillus sp. UFRGS-B20]|nr:hypothetical protein CW304_26955 [Bacillus sp. UFRGS-B20]